MCGVKRRVWWLSLAGLAWGLTIWGSAWAQGGSGSDRPVSTLSPKRPVISPLLPDSEVAKQDAEEAIRELEARERTERALREATPGLPRRPDLSPDVRSGIQSRQLSDALRRH